MGVSYKYCGKWPPDPRCTMRNLAGAATRVLGAAVRGEKVRVSKEVQEQRLAICRTCEKYVKNGERCRLCGCYMSGIAGKTSWSTERCPDNPPKWGPVNA